MKSLLSGFGMTIVLIFTIVIQSNIINFTSRSSELNNAVNNAVIDTQRIVLNGKYPISSSSEYIAEFTQNLMQYINSNSDIVIKVYAADEKTGLLDIGVISSFSSLKSGGKDRRAYEVRRTSIIDKFPNSHFNDEHLLDNYFVTFQVNTGAQLDLSELDFYVKKIAGTKSYKIPILGGNVTSVRVEGTSNESYNITTENGIKFLNITLSGIQSDINIIVN